MRTQPVRGDHDVGVDLSAFLVATGHAGPTPLSSNVAPVVEDKSDIDPVEVDADVEVEFFWPQRWAATTLDLVLQ